MAEPLKLGVLLTEEVSGALDRIGKSIRDVTRVGERDLRTLNRSFEQVGGGLRQVLTPALMAFGVSSLSVSGLVGGLATKLGDLAKKSEEMKSLAEWSGLTYREVN